MEAEGRVMPRLIQPLFTSKGRPVLDHLDLIIGTDVGLSEDEVRGIWEMRRDEIMREWNTVGARPVPFWAFEIGEPKPNQSK